MFKRIGAVCATAAIAAGAVGLALSSAVTAGASGTGFTSAEITAAVDGARSAFAAKYWNPGMAVAVVAPTTGGALATHIYAFGYADVARALPVTANTEFEIGSETKVFTSLLLADEVDSGAVGLDDPVSALLARDPPSTLPASPCSVPISALDLATHRSGLPDPPPAPWNRGGAAGRASYSITDLYTALAHTTLTFCPGSNWTYSDFGFGLLGTALGVFEQHPYSKLVEAQITGPLGMSSTMLEPTTPPAFEAIPYAAPCGLAMAQHCPGAPKPPGKPHCPCYIAHAAGTPMLGQPASTLATGGVPAPYWDNDGAMAGGGGLISSITDMATFVRAQLGSGPKDVVAAMRLTQQLVKPESGYASTEQMGLGWDIYTQPGGIGTFLFKNGGTRGMTSATILLPDKDLGVTLLTNDLNSPKWVALDILDTLLGYSAGPVTATS